MRRLVPIPAGMASRRLPGVEGLRAIAAGALVVHHVWILDGGVRLGEDAGAGAVFLNLALGVVLFFALSGFLLYRPFAAAIARGERLPGIRNYLRNRGLRILPAYWAILLFSALVLQTTGVRDDDGARMIGALTDPIELIKAALLIHDYDPGSMVVGIGPAWSLAVEAVFYLLLPLIVLAVARLARGQSSRSRRVVVLLAPPVVLLLVGLSGKLAAGVLVPGPEHAGYSSDWHSVIERSFWAQADLFSFGMAAAVLHTEIVDNRLRLPRGWRPAALGIAVAIFIPCAITLDLGQLSYLPQNTAVALAAALLLAVVTFPGDSARRPLLQRLLELRVVVAAGLISYSVFLWNEPVIHWLTEHGAMRGDWPGLGWNLALATVVVGALSILTYRLIELPALRRKRRPRQIDVAQAEAAP